MKKRSGNDKDLTGKKAVCLEIYLAVTPLLLWATAVEALAQNVGLHLVPVVSKPAVRNLLYDRELSRLSNKVCSLA